MLIVSSDAMAGKTGSAREQSLTKQPDIFGVILYLGLREIIAESRVAVNTLILAVCRDFKLLP